MNEEQNKADRNAQAIETKYLAMRAKEAPCPDDVERVRAAIFEARYPGVSMAGRESWCINEARAALSSIQAGEM